MRSRANWVEFGKRNNAYFLNLEKHGQSNNTIEKLHVPGGTTIQSDPEILESINEFCKELYRSSNPDYTLIQKCNQLSVTEKANLQD